jgi:putative oxidoreductase
MDLGLLVLRLAVGLLLAGHGTQKTFGWFVERAKTVSSFEEMGYRPASTFATVAGWVQLVGGLSLASGFATPLGAALIAGSSSQAIRVAKGKNGLWNQQDGYEYLLVLATIALALALSGPGAYSIDEALGWQPGGRPAALAVLGAVVVGAFFPQSVPGRRRDA